MDDIVFNKMMSFQFFCNNVFKQKNIDTLMPKGMKSGEWNAVKSRVIAKEIENMNRYLDQEALNRLAGCPQVNKQDIEKRFTDTILRGITSYEDKLKGYYYL